MDKNRSEIFGQFSYDESLTYEELLDVENTLTADLEALLPRGVTGRLLCVDKSLAALHVYWIQPGQWQEEERPVPVDPPQGLKTWRVPVASDAAGSAGTTENEN